MKKTLILTLVISFFSGSLFAQTTYPNNEDGMYEDMLTPAYYLAENDDPFRNEINKFVHFARLGVFHHPFEDQTGQIPQYETHRAFGDGIGLGGTSQHHPAADYHVGNGDTNVNIYAAYDGYVNTYVDAPKYRHYLSLTKDVEDSTGTLIGRIVTLYAHIDLDLDAADGILLDGQFVNKGDLVSKHLYGETMGGPHLHFEIRYYQVNDEGDEEFYGFVGAMGSNTLTDPSEGSWSYGFWNPAIGYGFGNPENHLFDTSVGVEENTFQVKVDVFPNPTKDMLSIDLHQKNQQLHLFIYDAKGSLLDEKQILSTPLISIDLERFDAGLYFIHLIDEESGQRVIVKVVKV